MHMEIQTSLMGSYLKYAVLVTIYGERQTAAAWDSIADSKLLKTVAVKKKT
ncbi:hypothetical protein FACS1894111_05330 [Clostridia bacterium]|nr:hypothetical protein FACS1894111_05330 [Clostridia bacterium]